MREFVAAVLTLAFASSDVMGQVACGKREAMLKHLGKMYQELPRLSAISRDNNLLEIIVSPKGTWTVLRTSPRGQTCIIDAGNDFTLFKEGTDL